MITCAFEDGAQANLRHAVVDTIVFNKDKTKVLLVKRAKTLHTGAGLWAIPGGYVDRDETTEEAAEREVLEETGHELVSVEFTKFIDNPNRLGDTRQNIAFVYTGVAGKQVGQPDDESEEVRWFDLNNLPGESEFAFDHRGLVMDEI